MSEYKSEGKPPMELLSPEFLKEISYVLEFGNNKHIENHYTDGVLVSKVLGSAIRHIFELMEGDIDHETGRHLAAHAAAALQIIFTLTTDPRYKEFDDRFSTKTGSSLGRRSNIPKQNI